MTTRNSWYIGQGGGSIPAFLRITFENCVNLLGGVKRKLFFTYTLGSFVPYICRGPCYPATLWVIEMPLSTPLPPPLLRATSHTVRPLSSWPACSNWLSGSGAACDNDVTARLQLISARRAGSRTGTPSHGPDRAHATLLVAVVPYAMIPGPLCLGPALNSPPAPWACLTPHSYDLFWSVDEGSHVSHDSRFLSSSFLINVLM